MVATEVNLLSHWGALHCIVDQNHNSYHLVTVQGLPVAGMVSTHCLRWLVPRSGTLLVEEQLRLELERTVEPDVPMEGLDFNEDAVDQEEVEVENVGNPLCLEWVTLKTRPE